MEEPLEPLYEHRKDQICVYCAQNSIISRKIREFAYMIPKTFNEFENFVKVLVDWTPAPDVLHAVWYNFWYAREDITESTPLQPAFDLYPNDNDVPIGHHVPGNEVPYEDAKKDNKYHLRSKGPILAAVPYENGNNENKYHLRSMGPIGAAVPQEDAKKDIKYHLRSMGPILAAVPYENENHENKYHLRSMRPILAIQPHSSSKLPANKRASTSNKRKASRNGPQTKHAKKNKKVKNEPLAEQ